MATFHNIRGIFETTEKLHGAKSIGFYFILVILFAITELVSDGILLVTESGRFEFSTKARRTNLYSSYTNIYHRVKTIWRPLEVQYFNKDLLTKDMYMLINPRAIKIYCKYEIKLNNTNP